MMHSGKTRVLIALAQDLNLPYGPLSERIARILNRCEQFLLRLPEMRNVLTLSEQPFDRDRQQPCIVFAFLGHDCSRVDELAKELVERMSQSQRFTDLRAGPRRAPKRSVQEEPSDLERVNRSPAMSITASPSGR
jgi:hypothetical protein